MRKCATSIVESVHRELGSIKQGGDRWRRRCTFSLGRRRSHIRSIQRRLNLVVAETE